MRYPLLAATALLLTAAAPATTTVAPRSRTFLLRCEVWVPNLPGGTRSLDFWMPVPHTDKSQEVRQVKVEAPVPYTIETDRYGNQMLHLHPRRPGARMIITLTARVTRREHLNLRATDDHAPAETEATDPNLKRWLAPDRLVPLDAKIKAQAQEVIDKAHATTPLAKARAIYEHVVSTVAYDKTGQGWGRGDIYYACDARRGNCTDFHAIVIGYCRALGIPARFSIGLPLPPQRGKGEVKGYHCWAEFFTKQTGWVPIDASEAAKDPTKRGYFFGAHDENRVEFTRGRDLTLKPKQAGPPLNYFVYPYAEANSKPLDNLERTYTYEDVAEK